MVRAYRGYSYNPWEDREEDCIKIFHEIRSPEGSNIEWNILPRWFINISPYSHPTQEQFEQAVDEVIFRRFAVGLGT